MNTNVLFILALLVILAVLKIIKKVTKLAVILLIGGFILVVAYIIFGNGLV